MARREYYHDAAAPQARELLPAAYAIVRNGMGRVLLVQRTDDGNWELPGGRIELGESASQAAVREVAEEADVTIEVTALAGVYSDPAHVLAYPRSGGVYQQLAVCFHAVILDRDARPDQDEISGAAWFDPEQATQLAMHPAMRQRLTDVELAAAQGYVEALCGHRMPGDDADCLKTATDPVCMPCVIGAMSRSVRSGTAR